MDDLDDCYDDVGAAGEGAAAGEEAQGVMPDLEQPAQPKQRRAPMRKRPKLTLEHLRAPGGLREVFDKFPGWFVDGFKGKGHEVRDLRRLLELYQRWQLRVFGECSFNQFEATLEKLSGTSGLKATLQEMRQGMIELVDPPQPEPSDADVPDDTAAGAAGEQPSQDAAWQQQEHQQEQHQQQPSLSDMDDELLELQAQAPAESPVPWAEEVVADEQAAPVAQAGFADELGAATRPAAASGGRLARPSMRDWSDDDDDSDAGPTTRTQELQQPHSQQHRPWQQRRQPAANSEEGERWLASEGAAAPRAGRKRGVLVLSDEEDDD